MAVELAQGYVTLLPSAKGFQAKLESQITPAARAAGGKAGGEAGRGFLSSWTQTAKGVVAGAVVYQGLSKAASFAGNAIFGFNSQLQNSQIAFTTMLGSGQKAQAFLNQLQAFAKKTPFTFPDLVKDSQLLLGMGINAKDVIPDLTALGDSVASVGGNTDTLNRTILAFAQMSARGRVDMQDMNQLLQGGMPNALRILAAQFHVTTGKITEMISAGKVSSAQALPALVKGIESGTSATAALGGMMDKQSRTFSGALSNIQDALQQALAQAFRPFFGEVNKGVLSLSNWLGSANFDAISTRLVGALKAAGSAILDLKPLAITVFQQVLVPAWDTLRRSIPPIVTALGNLWAVLKPIAADLATYIVVGFRALLVVYRDLTNALVPVTNFMREHATLFRAIAVGVLAMVAAWKSFTLAMNIARAAMALFTAVSDMNPIILAIGAVAVAAYLIVKYWQPISGFFARLWNDVKAIFSSVIAWIARNWQTVAQIVIALFLPGGVIIAALWRWHAQVFAFIGRIPGELARFFSAAGSWLLHAGEAIMNGLWTGIQFIWNHVLVYYYVRFPMLVIGYFVRAATWLLDAGRRIMSGLMSGITVGAAAVWNFFTGLAGQVITRVRNGATWLLGIGQSVIAGFLHGIGTAMTGIGSWIKRVIVDPVVDAVKHFFGVHSPSTVFQEIGGHLIAGFLKGFALDPLDVARKVFGTLPAALAQIAAKGLIDVAKIPIKGLQAIGNVIMGPGTMHGISGPNAQALLQTLAKAGFGGGGGGANLANLQGLGDALRGAPVVIGQSMAAALGWTGPEWNALFNLWMGESGWNPLAYNASSGATGIPQALPGSKMASAGADWRTNPATQIAWGLGYIRSVYGDPIKAYAMWLGRSPHWYDKGGIWKKGTTGVFGGNVDEAVIPLIPGVMKGLQTLAAAPQAAGGGRAGPAVIINEATFTDAADVDMLLNRVDFYVRAQNL